MASAVLTPSGLQYKRKELIITSTTGSTNTNSNSCKSKVSGLIFFCLPNKMSHNKLVKTLTDSANLAGLAVGIGWVAKKVIKKLMTSYPTSNLMNYLKSTVEIAASVATKNTLKN